jgi:membrane-anchored protein YejM (alkaline phosphatase superfamily)
MKDFSIEESNVLFMVFDSCRYDTMLAANIPNIKSIGEIRKAYTHGSYTVAAHASFFAGHLPVVLDEPLLPYYSESVKQLWRLKAGEIRDKARHVGVLLNGNNLFEGYEKMGYFILGTGGVSQFREKSLLRSFFKNFIYFGEHINEEPLEDRNKIQFPLHHVIEITDILKKHDKWFLYMNCPETHYPYDVDDGIPDDIKKIFSSIKHSLNLRGSIPDDVSNEDMGKLKLMQIKALEHIDKQVGLLIEKLPKNRKILVVMCGDHGDNFGEVFAGKRRWGHIFPSPQVMNVPLLIDHI